MTDGKITASAAALVGGWIVSLVLAGPTAAAPTEDIVSSGFNADLVTDADRANRRVTTAFDSVKAAWFEKGLHDGNALRSDGMPSGATFTSATGTGAQYTLRPALGPNALRLGGTTSVTGSVASGPSATLELRPGQYSSIAVLATSGNAPKNATATATIHYTEGPPTTFTYLAADWAHSDDKPPRLALGGLGRNADVGPSGSQFAPESGQRFGLWETIVTPQDGLDPTRFARGITFDLTGDAAPGSPPPTTSIFAVSGEPVPEAASMLLAFGAASCLALGTRGPRRPRRARRRLRAGGADGEPASRESGTP